MSDLEVPVEAPKGFEQPKKTRLQAHKLACHASIGGLYKIFIGNVLLNIVTLGIYTFWGRTRIRKYAASHIALSQSPFEYTGTGKELFFGFLKAYAFLLVFFIVAGVISKIHPMLGFVFTLTLIPLLFIAMYLAFRYRLGRLTWKSIRFGLDGRARDFAKDALVPAFLNLITLGVLLPKLQFHLWDRMMNNAYYGDMGFEFNNGYKKVMKVHLVTLAICAVFLIPGVILTGLGNAFAKMPGKEDYALIMLPGFALIFLSRIPRNWYKAKLWQEQLLGLRLSGLRFKSTAKGLDFFKLSFVNSLILVFTLGLGYPIIIARKLRFQAKHTIIAGDMSEIVALQAKRQKSGIGDVAADLDFGGGMDIGL